MLWAVKEKAKPGGRRTARQVSLRRGPPSQIASFRGV